jgi:hypothetical protein
VGVRQGVGRNHELQVDPSQLVSAQYPYLSPLDVRQGLQSSDQQSELFDPYSIIINKHLEGTFEGFDPDRKFIDNLFRSYNIYNLSTDFIIDYLNVLPGTLFLLNETRENIFIINYDYYIELELNDLGKIDKIKFNGYNIIKYSELSDPFKHVIPTNCLHLIYKINDEFNIAYFINQKYEKRFYC